MTTNDNKEREGEIERIVAEMRGLYLSLDGEETFIAKEPASEWLEAQLTHFQAHTIQRCIEALQAVEGSKGADFLIVRDEVRAALTSLLDNENTV